MVKSCDECGREVAKLHRIYKGHGYCSVCYARVFKRRACPKCGELARLPKSDASAVCTKCLYAKPCVRCGKSQYELGKRTPYGPACKYCAQFFRTPEPCQGCGRLSRRLSRVSRLGNNLRLCERCASVDYGICSACHRHRLLVPTGDGKPLCKKCFEVGEIACPSCGKAMPAGRGQLCEPCYWSRVANKRIRLNQAAFSSNEMAQTFTHFGDWLIQAVGPFKAAITINRYSLFFIDIEKHWRQIPSHSELLRLYGAEGLRRFRLPMRWLKEENGMVLDLEEQKADSERRQIAVLMNSMAQGSVAHRVLQEYFGYLTIKVDQGKTTIRSAKLAMRPALSLLQMVDFQGTKLPTQENLDDYLVKFPGQKAAVTGFTIFLNKRYHLDLKVRVDTKRTAILRKQKLEKTIAKMLQQPQEDENALRKWILVGMDYFYGLRVRRKDVSVANIEHQDNGIQVELAGHRYWLPHLESGLTRSAKRLP